jgi:hypothetical protein
MKDAATEGLVIVTATTQSLNSTVNTGGGGVHQNFRSGVNNFNLQSFHY